MIDDNWIDRILRKSIDNTAKEEKNNNNPFEDRLIANLIDRCYEMRTEDSSLPLGMLLACGFDLLVSAEYYSSLGHRGWFYCPSPSASLFHHYTNCCPRHALDNIFHFHSSSKPESGSIGRATSKLLRSYFTALLTKLKRKERILKGSEPVDVVILNEETRQVFFGEIKASPLLTLPLIMESEEITDDEGNEISEHDGELTINTVYNRPISLFVPILEGENWREKQFYLGEKSDSTDRFWGYRSMIELLDRDDSFFKTYSLFWNSALVKYHPKMTDSIYWLTNSCGSPNPRPDWWPKAKGGRGVGYESISDSKTSVGMDRTDDIKKGIYQILKLGSEGKVLSSKWVFKVGIVSNIHAARHFQEYLESLQNLIWTHDESGQAKKAGDLPTDHPLFNLFDGIIALTESHYRDEWLSQVFNLGID